MSLGAGALLPLLWGAAVATLQLQVDVHYPERDSPIEHCGFQLQLITLLAEPNQPVFLHRAGQDLFRTVVNISDDLAYTETSVGVHAVVDFGRAQSQSCAKVCPGLGGQGQQTEAGPQTRTQPLGLYTKVELWPAFCARVEDWRTVESSFVSKAIGRRVNIKTRIPAAALENTLPRFGRLLPPVLFRFNAEWYWPDSAEQYAIWHGLMIHGMMEPVAVAELWVEGLNMNSWTDQPIFTRQPFRKQCGHVCDEETSFICQAWEASSYSYYTGTEHAFGSAEAFVDELYDLAVPQVLRNLPAAADGAPPRLGVWGYCIGGLAAFNALTLRPDRFPIAYLGSPAVDFDCGQSFRDLESVNFSTGQRPKIYVDVGGAEDTSAQRQAKLLVQRLKRKGVVEGKEVFFHEAYFGSHQGSSLAHRALKGMLTLFGRDEVGRALPYVSMADDQADLAARADGPTAQRPPALLLLLLALLLPAAFVLGRLTGGRWRRGGVYKDPLLA